MFSNSSQDEQYKYTLLNLLTNLSIADHQVDSKEMSYILKVAQQLGVTADEFTGLMYNPKYQELQIPASEQDRMTILYYLLFLMKIDGIISIEETNLIKRISFKLGFNQNMTDELISTIREHLNQQIPPEKLLASLKKYMN